MTECPAHPGALVAVACARCGRFLCDRCRQLFADRDPVCAPCLERLLASPGSGALWALGLCCATFLGVIPGVVGLWLARQERARIGRKEAPVSGAPYLTVARSVFWAEAVALAVLAAAAFR